jgi:hypothetical protein
MALASEVVGKLELARTSILCGENLQASRPLLASGSTSGPAQISRVHRSNYVGGTAGSYDSSLSLRRLLELANKGLMLGAIGIFPLRRSAAPQTQICFGRPNSNSKASEMTFDPDARIRYCVRSCNSRAQAQK